MRRLFFIFVFLWVHQQTQALPNLPLSCSGPLAGLRCPETSYQYVPGKAGLMLATPSGVWTLWETLKPTDSVRICPQDIPVGGTCPVGRITVPKSQAAVEVVAPPTGTVGLRIRWQHVTLDAKNAPLPAGEIVGYVLSWRVPPSTLWTDIKLGYVDTFLYTAPRSQICFVLKAEGKSAYSESTDEVCITPGSNTKPGVPSALTVTEENPS